MTDGVAVGMPREALLAVEPHAPEPELALCVTGMHVEPETDANVSHD